MIGGLSRLSTELLALHWRQLESVTQQTGPGASQLDMAGFRRHGIREMRSIRPGKNQHSCHHVYSVMTLPGHASLNPASARLAPSKSHPGTWAVRHRDKTFESSLQMQETVQKAAHCLAASGAVTRRNPKNSPGTGGLSYEAMKLILSR